MRPTATLAELEAGSLTLAWPDATWSDVIASCRVGNGEEHVAGAWSRADDPAVFRAACGPLELELRAEPVDGALELRLAVLASAPAAVDEVALAGQAALAGAPAEWVLYSGFQSWDPAGTLPAGGATAAGVPVHRVSWWTLGLATATGAGLAAAARSALGSALRFDVEAGSLRAAWCQADGVPHPPALCELEAGAGWTSDPVRLAAGSDVRVQLAALLPGSERPGLEVPRGWLSWYHHGPWVTAEDVLANSALLARPEYAELGYRVIQVDDGWQQAYGDWFANEKFDGGLPAIARQLEPRGQRLGVWTAPFLVSASSRLAAEAPDAWFVRDGQTGERVTDPRHLVFGPMQVLDASRPEVRAHLRDTFARLREEGVGYFKIDFLYAGAYAGTAALRAGVAAIREGIGDSYLLACGAPLLPVVGLADGCRVGQDTATPIFDFEAGGPRPSVFGEEVLSVCRNVAARQYLQGCFQIDADVALVGGNLSLEQGRQLVTAAALSGGPFFASDDLGRLPPERLALLSNPEVLELVGDGCAVPDWQPDEADRPPAVWRRGDVVAVFNWHSEERRLEVPLPAGGRLRDLWTGGELGRAEAGSGLAVPAGGVRLIRVLRG